MGKCKYCQQDAGWFSSSHDACKQKFENGRSEILTTLRDCFRRKEDFYLRKPAIESALRSSYIDTPNRETIFLSALDEAVELYLDDGIIDATEQKTIARFIQFSGMSQASLNVNRSLEKMVQSQVLQDILNGNKPAPRITIGGDFPFLLSKSESLVWLFRDVTLHEQKVQREYVGRSRGISVRIARGVYYRTGGFKGKPVETSYMQRISTGSVCLTDKNLYYSSPEKSFKIPYTKIVSVESFSNGVSIQKDGANSKPVFLAGINSWFCYNVIANYKD